MYPTSIPMTRVRALLLTVLAALLAAWAMSSSSAPILRSIGVTGPARATDPLVPRRAVDLEVRIDRLGERLAATAAPPRDGGRNPFRFGGDVRAPREPSAARPNATPSTPALSLPVVPTVSLLGIVDRTVEGNAVRVAVVSIGETLYYVSVGERVGTRYEVITVSADSIDLKDLTDGSTRRVRLR